MVALAMCDPSSMKCALLLCAMASSLHAETGSLTIHRILHAVGEERYEVVPAASGVTLHTVFEYSDRGTKHTATADLSTTLDGTPINLEIREPRKSVEVQKTGATVTEDTTTRTFSPPERYFTVFGPFPFAVQMMMVRYWKAHGKPAKLPVLRQSPNATPIEMALVGHDSIVVDGHTVLLDRYTIANLMFGREVLWMNAHDDLAAAMTFAGGLPMEAVRTEYESALLQLYRAGVAQEMADLAALAREAPAERRGDFAIMGARLIDATGAAPVEDSVVIVRGRRIAAAGPRGVVAIPSGMPVVDAKGKSLLPGLWEMHAHFSGVEFGPALLAAGITTARDCGGEFDFLVAQRDALNKRGRPRPAAAAGRPGGRR